MFLVKFITKIMLLLFSINVELNDRLLEKRYIFHCGVLKNTVYGSVD